MEKQAQVRITPTKWQAGVITSLAEETGDSQAGVIMKIIEHGIVSFMSQIEQGRKLMGGDSNPLRTILLRLASGDDIPDTELSIIAHDHQIPIDLLLSIKDCLQERGEANVPINH